MANKFFQSLGYGDVDYEISNIRYYSNYFKETKDVAYDDLRKKGLTYLKVNIAMGIALSIIFI